MKSGCRFLGCVHIGEKVCGVKDAVAEGKISRSRYDNYRLMYDELKAEKEILTMEYKVAPSLLAADFTRLGEQVHEIEEAGAPYLHLDVMDGAFVPSISFGMPVLKSLRKVTNMTFDVHMMVEEPGRYIEDIKNAGADIITVHAEACTHLDRVVNQIKEAGCKAGVALNPATPVSVLECILGQVDMVLIMTVNPGFGGQKFIPYTLEKVKQVRAMCDAKGSYC